MPAPVFISGIAANNGLVGDVTITINIPPSASDVGSFTAVGITVQDSEINAPASGWSFIGVSTNTDGVTTTRLYVYTIRGTGGPIAIIWGFNALARAISIAGTYTGVDPNNSIVASSFSPTITLNPRAGDDADLTFSFNNGSDGLAVGFGGMTYSGAVSNAVWAGPANFSSGILPNIGASAVGRSASMWNSNVGVNVIGNPFSFTLTKSQFAAGVDGIYGGAALILNGELQSISNGAPDSGSPFTLIRGITVPIRQNFHVLAEFFQLGSVDALSLINSGSENDQKIIEVYLAGTLTREVN